MNSEITYDMLSDREYTDGRIIFEIPANFTIEQTKDSDSGITLFSLEMMNLLFMCVGAA